MSEIALYNTLRKIPEVSEVEAKEAVADVANSKEVATKADIAKIDKTITELKAETKADIAELQAETKADIAELQAETKADIAELQAETKADIAKVDKTITELKAETKADIAKVDKTIAELKGELRADIERMGRIMLMWMAGIGLAIIGVIKYL